MTALHRFPESQTMNSNPSPPAPSDDMNDTKAFLSALGNYYWTRRAFESKPNAVNSTAVRDAEDRVRRSLSAHPAVPSPTALVPGDTQYFLTRLINFREGLRMRALAADENADFPSAAWYRDLRVLLGEVWLLMSGYPTTPAKLPEWVEHVVARIDACGAHHQMEHERALVYMRDYIADRLSVSPAPTEIESILVRLRSAVKGCGDGKRHDTACGNGVPDPVTGMRPVCWDCGDEINRCVVALTSPSRVQEASNG